ncbi:MAG: hypothetical protein A3I66_11930 [Burkholderiales bacterium RIFCSPLOWO2_02_FULL_57_36]|nr:MAG: hypothetical protein A3I66_11930 [Burkholderiales bacterium RIFCSPLOWO2_02_FULL_57_36]
MNKISDYLGADHARCDDLFEHLELFVNQAKWEDAETAFEKFERAMERHFGMEETVLFVAFEQATGSSAGPTSIMRMEHQHLRDIIGCLSEAVRQHDADDFFGNADTLRIMMHQHNQKEESILYLMTDRVLSDRHDEIISVMRQLGTVGVVDYLG